MAENLVHGAKGVIRNSQQAARVIKEVSPSTLVFMDEVGILLGCDPPFNATDTLGDGPLSNWWNIQSVVWALFVGDLTAAGVDMVGASQVCVPLACDLAPTCRLPLASYLVVFCSSWAGRPVMYPRNVSTTP